MQFEIIFLTSTKLLHTAWVFLLAINAGLSSRQHYRYDNLPVDRTHTNISVGLRIQLSRIALALGVLSPKINTKCNFVREYLLLRYIIISQFTLCLKKHSYHRGTAQCATLVEISSTAA